MKKLFAIATSAACLSLVNPLLANDAHHPDQGQTPTTSAPAAKAPAKTKQSAAPAKAATTPAAQADMMGEQMKKMQEMHDKMMAAKTPEERQKLMDEHMKVMQDGMAMMKGKGGIGLIIDRQPQQVGGQHVGGKLHALII